MNEINIVRTNLKLRYYILTIADNYTDHKHSIYIDSVIDHSDLPSNADVSIC